MMMMDELITEHAEGIYCTGCVQWSVEAGLLSQDDATALVSLPSKVALVCSICAIAPATLTRPAPDWTVPVVVAEAPRVAIYARVGPGTNNPEQALARQIDAARADAAAHGWTNTVVHAEIFDGNALARPVLDALREEVRAGRYTHVLLLNLSRLGRSPVGVRIVLDEWHRAGVRVVYGDA
jgi:hypothetical protein